MNIILFGFKGCGKTHFGKLLAAKLNRPFLDTDTILEELYQLKIRELHQQMGEVKFRALETEAIATLLDVKNAVISLGGGAVLDRGNVELLTKIGRLVYLQASFETIQKRLKETPSFAVDNSLEAIYRARKPIYEAISSHRINTDLLDEAGVLSALYKLINLRLT